jgi:tetratricopeptide (TPR) repeat protein
VTGPTPQQYRDIALSAERAGDIEGARRTMAEAVAAFPANAELANSAGSLAMRAGAADEAERLFARAAQSVPDNLEFATNRSIALFRLGRSREAVAVLELLAEQGRTSARYCSARGAAERACGNLAEAARWYDLCIALDPKHARGLHGRARVAIERGEDTAADRFERALSAAPTEADLWLGKAQALDVAGQTSEARALVETIVEQAPQWLEALRFLAQLKLAAGEEDWAGHYREAERRFPDDASLPFAQVALLGGLDRDAQAAEVAAAARRRFPERQEFALLEARHASAAGDDARAGAIFASLALATAERRIEEARHRIRLNEPEAADALLGQALADEPWSVNAWALRGIAWRMLGDPRAEWLHGQAGLVARLPLEDHAARLAEAVPLLDRLHDGSPFPLGQSLRGGSQTRGILFDRLEPELARLQASIRGTLEAYRAGLPPEDPAHPLLRHRDAPWQLAGSWSVRLSGGGDFHTAHIHPQGIVSSALYLAVPPAEPGATQAGWLEVGRPPPDLRVDLPPLATIEPLPGHLALFPSTLYHGTRPFAAARRMTVAFDVTPTQEDS